MNNKSNGNVVKRYYTTPLLIITIVVLLAVAMIILIVFGEYDMSESAYNDCNEMALPHYWDNKIGCVAIPLDSNGCYVLKEWDNIECRILPYIIHKNPREEIRIITHCRNKMYVSNVQECYDNYQEYGGFSRYEITRYGANDSYFRDGGSIKLCWRLDLL